MLKDYTSHMKVFGRARRLVVLVCLTAGLSAVVPLLTPTAAEAYNLIGSGCRFQNSTILYNDETTYTAATTGALTAWNNATGVIHFTAASGTGSLILLQQNGGNNGADGITNYTCGTLHWAGVVDSAYNTYYTQNYGGPKRQSVMAHEIGHSLGLAHNNKITSPCSKVKLMYYATPLRWDTCKINTPQPDDVNGVNSIY